MYKKLIFIELNEINFDLIKIYSLRHNFKVFNEDFFSKLKTTKSEDTYELIEPWIQWVSVHTGLEAREHNIFRLGDIDNKHNFKQIFNVVEDKGYTVGAVCPMNVKNDLKKTKYFIPDPWSKNQNPKSFIQNKIYNALSEAVNKNSGNSLSFKTMFTILFSILFYVRKKNFLKFIKYTIKSFKNKWYKALLFDFLLNEIHLKFIKKYNKDFSTIFFNAGAHIQHHYMNNSKALDSSKKNPEWYVKSSTDPILEAYIFYDEIINEYLKMNKSSILIATGLSQIPYDKSTFYYRLSNHSNFFDKLNLKYLKIEPRMSRDFLVNFQDEESSKQCEEKLKKINELNKEKIFEFDNRGISIFISFVYANEILRETTLKIDINNEINLYQYVNFVAIKNGKHSPKGFMFAKGDIEEVIEGNNFHVKKIFNIINSYFKK